MQPKQVAPSVGTSISPFLQATRVEDRGENGNRGAKGGPAFISGEFGGPPVDYCKSPRVSAGEREGGNLETKETFLCLSVARPKCRSGAVSPKGRTPCGHQFTLLRP